MYKPNPCIATAFAHFRLPIVEAGDYELKGSGFLIVNSGQTTATIDLSYPLYPGQSISVSTNDKQFLQKINVTFDAAPLSGAYPFLPLKSLSILEIQ